MKTFAYRAYTAEGARRRGQIMAEDSAEATRKLRADGLFVEDLSDGAAVGPRRRRGKRLDPDMQALFARQMAVLLSSGLPVDEALKVIHAGSGGGAIADVSLRVRAQVLEGAPLSEGLRDAAAGFAPYIVSAVKAGEASRDLAAVFETIATHLETRRSDRAALATALIYPAFVAAVSLLVCGILMVTVAPQLAEMFAATGQPLPPLTRAMLAATDWGRANGIWLVAGLGLLVLGVPLALRNDDLRARWHRFVLRLPVLGRLKQLDEAAQYLRTLALVVASRQPVIEGVRNATDVLSVRDFREDSDAVTAAINAGASLSSALGAARFVPPVARQLVEAGEKSARVAAMTERAALLVETWLVNDRKRLATLLDPILMMLIGAFVLVVVLSVLLPIFDMQSSIQL